MFINVPPCVPDAGSLMYTLLSFKTAEATCVSKGTAGMLALLCVLVVSSENLAYIYTTGQFMEVNTCIRGTYCMGLHRQKKWRQWRKELQLCLNWDLHSISESMISVTVHCPPSLFYTGFKHSHSSFFSVALQPVS